MQLIFIYGYYEYLCIQPCQWHRPYLHKRHLAWWELGSGNTHGLPTSHSKMQVNKMHRTLTREPGAPAIQ